MIKIKVEDVSWYVDIGTYLWSVTESGRVHVKILLRIVLCAKEVGDCRQYIVKKCTEKTQVF